MNDHEFYEQLIINFREIINEKHLLEEEIIISAKALSTEEAIGQPQRQNYPIQAGKERLMQAEFRGAKGQAFTDMSASFRGSLAEVLEKRPSDNCDRATLIASINAVMRYLNLIEGTVHCHDEEPEECAAALVAHIKEKYNHPRIALIGLQPAMLDKLSQAFSVRVVDLDVENIGKTKHGVEIEGFEHTQEVIDWCNLIIATGSTSVNATINKYIGNKPALFYGTSCAAVAHLMNLERWCYKGA